MSEEGLRRRTKRTRELHADKETGQEPNPGSRGFTLPFTCQTITDQNRGHPLISMHSMVLNNMDERATTSHGRSEVWLDRGCTILCKKNKIKKKVQSRFFSFSFDDDFFGEIIKISSFKNDAVKLSCCKGQLDNKSTAAERNRTSSSFSLSHVGWRTEEGTQPKCSIILLSCHVGHHKKRNMIHNCTTALRFLSSFFEQRKNE